MNTTRHTTQIAARDLRAGSTIVDTKCGGLLQLVKHITTCPDGSLRIITDHGDQRMTGSIRVCVLH